MHVQRQFICDLLAPMLMRGNPSHIALSTPPITSSRIPTQLTTRHCWRGRTGRERRNVEADVDEGGPRAQASTDHAACADVSHTSSSHQGRGPAQAQDRSAAPRGRRRAAPGTSPRHRPPLSSNLPRHAPCQPQQDGGKGRCPVVSNRPLHCVMQQRCHHASASVRIPSSRPMSSPRLHLSATDRQDKFQLPIEEENFSTVIAFCHCC